MSKEKACRQNCYTASVHGNFIRSLDSDQHLVDNSFHILVAMSKSN